MKMLVSTTGVLSALAAAPAHSIVSLHSIVCQQIGMFGVDPGLATAGVLLLAGTIAYRLKKAA